MASSIATTWRRRCRPSRGAAARWHENTSRPAVRTWNSSQGTSITNGSPPAASSSIGSRWYASSSIGHRHSTAEPNSRGRPRPQPLAELTEPGDDLVAALVPPRFEQRPDVELDDPQHPFGHRAKLATPLPDPLHAGRIR
jgi:hypothetical protein